MFSPPRAISKRYLPITGTPPAIAVPTLVAKKASWFQGSRYPLKPNVMNTPSRAMPVNQVNSRGRR